MVIAHVFASVATHGHLAEHLGGRRLVGLAAGLGPGGGGLEPGASSGS